jgi:hypothetical protein
LASAVIGGVLIWWLTSSGGPLDKKEPSVRIVALSTFSRSGVGLSPSATLSVANEGDGTASRCQILWSPLTGEPTDTPFPASTEFSLDPGESREERLATATTYTEAGRFEMAAQVVCEGVESSVVTATVSVE